MRMPGGSEMQNPLTPAPGSARSIAAIRCVRRHATSFVIRSVRRKAACNLLIRVWSAMPGSQSFGRDEALRSCQDGTYGIWNLHRLRPARNLK